MRKQKLSIIISILFLFIGLTSAIIITNINPTGDLVTSDDTVNLSYGIDASDGLSSITHSWNGTNTTLWDYQLVGYWAMNNYSTLDEFTNGTGTPQGKIRDLSGYENNGTLYGGTNITFVTDGAINGAYNWTNGSKAYIQIASTLQMNISGNITTSAWVRINKLTGAETQTIIEKNGNWKMYIDGDRTVRFTPTGLDDTFPSGTATAITDYNWHHVAFTYDGTNMRTYLDGNLQTTDTASGSMTLNNKGVYIGMSAGSSNPFNGSIDEVMVWNRSLTTNEINNLYKSKITKYNSTYFEYNITSGSLNAYLQSSFLCSTNLTGSIFCSSTYQSRQINTIKANFSISKGIIKNDFYSMSSYTPYGSEYSWIDTNNDGTFETISDYQWHRDNIRNANVQTIRLYLWTNEISVSEGVFNTTATNNNYKNINTMKSWVDYAKLTNMTVLLSVFWTPTWLQDRTSGWCTSTNWATCSPSNYTKYGELVVDALDYIGCDATTCRIAVWNEPDYEGSWLNNLSRTNTTRSIEYNKLYNATWIEVKKAYPNMDVGGPVTTSSITRVNGFLFDNWASNFSNQTDFVELHSYLQQANTNYSNYDDMLGFDLPFYMGVISKYNGNVTDYIYTELNFHNSSSQVLNTSAYSSYRGMQIALAMKYFLNSYPDNVSMGWYQFSDSNAYYGNSQKFEMTSEPLLNNSKDIVYYVYSNFSHLCPAGATVYVTSGDDSDIKQVSCKKGNQYSLIVINTGTEAKNITLNMSMENGTVVFPYAKLTNYEDDSDVYTISSGISQLGVLDSYDILYLVNDSQAPTITINSPTGNVVNEVNYWFNVTLDEEGSSCFYSLNGGANVTMEQQGALSQFKYLANIPNGLNIITFYCNDTYNNWGTASSYITGLTPGGAGTGDETEQTTTENEDGSSGAVELSLWDKIVAKLTELTDNAREELLNTTITGQTTNEPKEKTFMETYIWVFIGLFLFMILVLAGRKGRI